MNIKANLVTRRGCDAQCGPGDGSFQAVAACRIHQSIRNTRDVRYGISTKVYGVWGIIPAEPVLEVIHTIVRQSLAVIGINEDLDRVVQPGRDNTRIVLERVVGDVNQNIQIVRIPQTSPCAGQITGVRNRTRRYLRYVVARTICPDSVHFSIDCRSGRRLVDQSRLTADPTEKETAGLSFRRYCCPFHPDHPMYSLSPFHNTQFTSVLSSRAREHDAVGCRVCIECHRVGVTADVKRR